MPSVAGSQIAASAARKTRASSDRVGREYVQGLQRGFAVIKAFGADAQALTIADVAARTGLTRAVARRYLLTLGELGCAVHNGSQFRLTPRVLDLGFTYLSTINVADVSQPFMERVVEKLHESCSVSVLDGHDCVYVGRVAAKRIMSINLVVGSRLPAHATSMGKVLLAHVSPPELDGYFATAPLQRLTKRTICDETTLRRALREVKERGWAFGGGAALRSLAEGAGRDQRVRPRRARVDELAAPRVSAGAARRGPPDLARPRRQREGRLTDVRAGNSEVPGPRVLAIARS